MKVVLVFNSVTRVKTMNAEHCNELVPERPAEDECKRQRSPTIQRERGARGERERDTELMAQLRSKGFK